MSASSSFEMLATLGRGPSEFGRSFRKNENQGPTNKIRGDAEPCFFFLTII